MSLFGRVVRFFRTDAAAPAPLALAPAPAPSATRRDSAGISFGMGGGFSNPHSGVGVGGVDPRLDTTYQMGWMTDELAAGMWHGEWLMGKLVSLLPEEAIEPGFTLSIQEDDQAADGTVEHRGSAELVEAVDTRHEDLGTLAAIKRADEWNRLFGGSAIWAGANDGVADDWAKPLQLDSPTLSMRWLRVLRSREMMPHRYYRDPNHPKYGKVEVWQIQPRTNAQTAGSLAYVHESRLFIYPGLRIVDDGTIATQNFGSWEFGDGICRRLYGPVRRYLQALDNTELTMGANGEGVWQHNGLAGILAADGAEAFAELARAMSIAQSVLRARVIGEGQTFTRSGAPMAGLDAATSLFMSECSGASGIPRSKLFGEAAGGLGSTGESQHGDWDETKAAHRKHNQLPAYRWITDMILRSLGGRPKRWKVEGKPYRQLSAKEQAELTKLEADTDVVLSQLFPAESIMARQIWRDRYQLEAPDAAPAGDEMLPDDIRGEEGDDPATASAPGVEAPPAEGPKLAEQGLNGAQALALSAIVEKVAAGTMPRESGSQLVQFSFKVPPEQAEKMMPPAGYKPAAVEGGLQAAPAPAAAAAAEPPIAEPPRTDAAERTMAALLSELSPDGTCDDCGEAHPLEVDHIEGRGWAPAALSKAQRTARYWQEYDDGVPLRALCRSCNGRDGAANKQGKSGPRHRADGLEADERGDAVIGAEPATPGETVDIITPYQRRALDGEDRDSLVATLELVMGIDPTMAERLIPAGPGTFGGGDDPEDDEPEPNDDPDDLDEEEEELDLDDEEDEEDLDEDDGVRHDSAASRVDEERDDCKNPVRGEGGRFAGCAPGEGEEGGSRATGGRGRAAKGTKEKPAKTPTKAAKKTAAKAKAPAKKPAKAPAKKRAATKPAEKTAEKKQTPKQKATAEAKATRAAERERKAAEKEAARMEREKAKAEKARATAERKAAKDKAKAEKDAAKLEKMRAKTEAKKAKAEEATKKAEAATKAREEAQRRAGVPVTAPKAPKAKAKDVEAPAATDRQRQLEEATRASKLGPGGRTTYQAPGPNQLGDNEHEKLIDQIKTSFDQPDRIAALDYTETNAVWQINSKLRKIKPPAAAMGGRPPIQPDLDVTIRQLDGIIAKAPPLDRPVTVFRGVKPGTKLDNLKPGDTFQDPAYSSVSTRADLAYLFTGDEETNKWGGVVLRISVPKGTRAAALPSKFSATERELLLGRNSKFRVDRVVESHIPTGPREVFVTLQ